MDNGAPVVRVTRATPVLPQGVTDDTPDFNRDMVHLLLYFFKYYFIIIIYLLLYIPDILGHVRYTRRTLR